MATVRVVHIECDVCESDGAESVRLGIDDAQADLDLCAEHRKQFDEVMEPWHQLIDKVVARNRAAQAALRPARGGAGLSTLVAQPRARRSIAKVQCPAGCGRPMPRGNIARHLAAKHPEAQAS